MTKILISPCFGAGWSTWQFDANKEMIKLFLAYQPLIDAIEKHGNPSQEFSQAMENFKEEIMKRFPDEEAGIYLGGARCLAVTEVTTPFRIHEYDGSETVECRDELDWIDPDEL